MQLLAIKTLKVYIHHVDGTQLNTAAIEKIQVQVLTTQSTDICKIHAC